MGTCDTAPANGRCGSNVYEVNQWLWQFGRGKQGLGGLSVKKTDDRKEAALSLGRSRACMELRLAGIARLIWPDGKGSVVVKLYIRVCTMSIHIFIFMNVYVTCTYIDLNSCTSLQHVHTKLLIHEHVCT